MVIRILLLLLSALFLSQCAENKIDLDQCGKNTDCFVRDSCIEGKTRDDLLTPRTNEKLKTGGCDVILQIRAFKLSKFHVMMQVIPGDETKTIADSGVSFKQDKIQFACTKEGPIVNTELFKIELKGGDLYEKDNVFCSFTMETIDKAAILLKFATNAEHPGLEFSYDLPQSIKFNGADIDFWKKMDARCNPEILTSLDSSDGVFLQDKIDTFAYPPIKCEPPNSLLTTRKNKLSLLNQEEALECKVGEWTYMDDSVSISVPKTGEMLNVVCGSRYCSLCSPIDPLNGPGRSKPAKQDVEGGCQTFTCPDTNNLWMLNDGSVVEGGSIECKQEVGKTNSRNAFWYLTNEEGPIKVEKAACFDKTICNQNKIFHDGCPPNMDCIYYNISSDKTELFCPEGWKLAWTVEETVGYPSKIECDFATGYFTDKGNNTAMKSSYAVGCAGKPFLKKTEPAKSNLGPIMAGAGGGLALLAAIGVGAFLIVRKRRAAAATEAPKTAGTDSVAVVQPYVPPTADADAANKKAPEKPREPWLARNRNRPEIVPTHHVGNVFSAGDFLGRIIPEFVSYSAQDRITTFYQVTAFNAYGEPPADMENQVKDYGTMNQFWLIFKTCEEKNMDDIVLWEMIFRFVRIMHGMMEASNLLKLNFLDARIKARMIKFARPIFDELGWKIRPGEDPSDTQMRFFVVRVLLWSNDEEIKTELKRQAALPIEELESPMRAVVFLYNARFLGASKEMLKKHFKSTIIDDPKSTEEKDKFGTLRQHLLFGLCATYDIKKMTYVMTDLLDKLTDFKLTKLGKTFTPIDTLWAYRGATEYYSNMSDAVFTFEETVPRNLLGNRQRQLEKRVGPDAGAAEIEPIDTAWKKATLDMMYLLGECCTWQRQYEAFGSAAVDFLRYCEQDDNALRHDRLLFERANNIDWRLASDANKALKHWKAKETLQFKVIDEFEKAFKTFEKEVPGRPKEQLRTD